MYKIFMIKDFIHVLKQQKSIHDEVLETVNKMHFKPNKLIKFENHENNLINKIMALLHQYRFNDVISINVKTLRYSISRKDKIIKRGNMAQSIVSRL